MEIWKDIEGYEGLYQVSNYGDVLSLYNNITLRQRRNYKNYLFVKLYKNSVSKQFAVHRLVAQAFIPNPNNLPQVNHKNEIKDDNRPVNLEWCDAKYNINYGTARERGQKNGKEKNIPRNGKKI